MRARQALAVAPFLVLAAVLRDVPLPPATSTPLPWTWAVGNAALLLAALTAHTWCYARWQPAAPRRMLANEALARLWFVVYGVLLVQRVGPNGWAFSLVAVPWAALAWEVHRQDVRKRGYAMAWNLGNWGLFLLG